ncbi:MAG: phosphate/phosphite/phosphonate ABC transporter substrate-binding protein [Nitrospirae bacterium]|nr:phosphate/phosphite/phosphonate ABC transporter substrate-binding protein [Nitrospirota bacterium]
MNQCMRLCLFFFLMSFASFFWQFPALEQHAAYAGQQTYSIGVVPQFEQRKLHAIWKPIIEDLEKSTGLTFSLNSTLTIEAFEKAIERGEFDFVYLNPYHLVQVHDAQGYIPLVADKVPLRGILVVRKNSPIHTPAELDGKVVAFPSPNAIGATLLPKADLNQLFHASVKPLYVKTHSSVYLHVVKDLAAAGGGVEKTLQEQNEEIRSALRTIYTTRSFPSHPVAAHPRVPADIREKVRKALLSLNSSPEGREMLRKVPVEQLIPVTYSDYAVMSSWGIEKYWQPVSGD